MGVGDYLSNMFLGNTGGDSEGTKRGTDELWKVYRQAYNIKPVGTGNNG